MDNPNLWYAFAGLFVLAGLLNAAKALRSSGPPRFIRMCLAAACVCWSAVSLLYRFGAQPVLLYGAIGLGVVMMLVSALFSAGQQNR